MIREVVCLIAHTPTPERAQILQRALASVLRQTAYPTAIVLVHDISYGDPIFLEDRLGPIAIHHLSSSSAGASNAWNLGIAYLSSHWPASYVAILDDDDTWDSDHLETCLGTARQNHWPDLVLSGIRSCIDGQVSEESPLTSLSIEDFLVGNPGWKGSNTFVSNSAIRQAGCFTPDLPSCNDRDLAIRMLSIPDLRLAFTGKNTVTWYHDTNRPSLSLAGSSGKLQGLAQFYRLHNEKMSPDIREQFFSRAFRLFGFTREQILS